MFETLFAFFTGAKMNLVSQALSRLAPLLEHLENNYTSDHNAKNALIDTIVTILQQHKQQPPTS